MIALVLAIVAAVLAGIEIVRSQGQSLLAWAVLCLAAIVLLARL